MLSKNLKYGILLISFLCFSILIYYQIFQNFMIFIGIPISLIYQSIKLIESYSSEVDNDKILYYESTKIIYIIKIWTCYSGVMIISYFVDKLFIILPFNYLYTLIKTILLILITNNNYYLSIMYNRIIKKIFNFYHYHLHNYINNTYNQIY